MTFMNNTPNSNRKHIAFFGKRNAGKSTLFNLVLGQQISLVSDFLGTTTDPVYKQMELLDYGPVRFIDTAGLDDIGELGKLRVKKSHEVLSNVDVAIYVLDSSKLQQLQKDQNGNLNINNETLKKIYGEEKREAKILFQKFRIPYVFLWNKLDLLNESEIEKLKKENSKDQFLIDKNENDKKAQLIEIIKKCLENEEEDPSLIGDLLPYGSKVILVVPIDSEAPKGRLILPQVQILRDCLDNGIKSYVVRDTELEEAIKEIPDVDLVITDSQAFDIVNKILPKDVPLTSFSILFARQKGELTKFVEGVKKLEQLKNEKSATILIAESCTHTVSHEDIGTVKIPMLLKKKVNENFKIIFQNGVTFKDEILDKEKVDLIIHCGSCMITRKNMLNRIQKSEEKEIPITNYGVVLAYLTGILDRSIEIFKK